MDASREVKVGEATHKDQKVQLFIEIKSDAKKLLGLSKNKIKKYRKLIMKI
jgi:hypothetical protein